MSSKTTTIFKQLIFNVVFPAIIALLVLGVLNYQNTKIILVDSATEKNEIIADEITRIHELQDLALGILENELNERMEIISNTLVNDIFKDTRDIETVDLNRIRKELRMNASFEDIYVINRQGIVVNTTLEADMGLNLFDFGVEHKNLLLGILASGEYVSERFAVENRTRRVKKFTYQPSNDKKYIIELGIYSSKADEIIQVIKDRLTGLAGQGSSIMSTDLFIGSDDPFSLNGDVHLDEKHREIYNQVLEDENTIRIEEGKGRTRLNYEFIYMPRRDTDLYKGGVIRIISDYSEERKLLRIELLKFIAIFGLTLIIVVILLYKKTKVITDPIKKLVQNVDRITNGHLYERAEVQGRNEITKLSEKFNIMIEQLESYTNELEQKVKERTAEIEKQKEEIEAQRDSLEEQRNMLAETNENLQQAYTQIEEKNTHIEDSIRYAKRIQNAILPPDEYVKSLLPDYFILYLPKDIVSGDFYWASHKDGKVFIAAVDCTGHGVPGAFMSIVGQDQLDYAVNVKGARTPAEILNALNKGVTDTLRQTRTEISVKDGMDISLISVDFTKLELEYAGAFNPLYHVRKGEISQVTADKFPIGAFLGEDLNQFTNHSVRVEKSDVIYIFSDGYSDQFGGPKNKKFMSKRFREMLTEISNDPMEDQKQRLYDTFLEWKGDNIQIDDILVIGIRM